MIGLIVEAIVLWMNVSIVSYCSLTSEPCSAGLVYMLIMIQDTVVAMMHIWIV